MTQDAAVPVETQPPLSPPGGGDLKRDGVTPTITRCGNGEFLLKFVHEGRTMMTWVLTRAQAQEFWLLLDRALDEEME